jgi:hypothetical protein
MFQIKVVEKIKTHIYDELTFYRKSCRLWDNFEVYGIAGHMRTSRWITKSTDTQYWILNAFPWQQWLRERASRSRYKYTACLVTAVVANSPEIIRLRQAEIQRTLTHANHLVLREKQQRGKTRLPQCKNIWPWWQGPTYHGVMPWCRGPTHHTVKKQWRYKSTLPYAFTACPWTI